MEVVVSAAIKARHLIGKFGIEYIMVWRKKVEASRQCLHRVMGRGRDMRRDGRVAGPQAVVVTSGPAGFRCRPVLGPSGDGAPHYWGPNASAAPSTPAPGLPSAVYFTCLASIERPHKDSWKGVQINVSSGS